MEFTEDKLRKLVREEAAKKLVSEKKTEVKKFLTLQEQRSTAQVRSDNQRGYLGGSVVGAFQGQLGITSRIFTPDFKVEFAANYMDGRKGRATRSTNEDEIDSALRDFQLEVEEHKLGPYTHRAWEIWVGDNYTSEQRNKATQVYNDPRWGAELAKIFDDSDETVPIQAPSAGSVAHTWEVAGRELGWTIGTRSRLQGYSRSTTYHVENARDFMQAIISNSNFGGFNPRLVALALAETDEAAERARRRTDEEPDEADRSRQVDISTIEGSDVAAVVPQRQNEPQTDYGDRLDASAAYLNGAPLQFGLSDIPLEENPAEIELGGLYDYGGQWQSNVPTQVYFLITPGNLPGPRGQKKMHPIITKGALNTLSQQMAEGFYHGAFSGIGANVGAGSIESWIQLIKWLSGTGNRCGGGVFDGTGGGNLSGRVGYRDGGGVYDALSYLLAQFKSNSSATIDSDFANMTLVDAALQSEYTDDSDDWGDDDDVNKRRDYLGRLTRAFVQRPGGRRRANTDTVLQNPWVVRLAKERTDEIAREINPRIVRESASETFSRKEISSLSSIITGAIQESFGVENVSRRTGRSQRRAPVRPVAEPPAAPPTRRGTVFSIGMSNDPNSIIKIQRFFNTANTGVWSGDDDRSFLSYFELYYSGRLKPGLSGVLQTGGWDAMAQYLAVNQIGGGYNSGPSGLLSFITTPGYFSSQRRRIRNFERDE